MEYVSGEILTPDGFQKGYLGFEKSRIIETGKNIPPKKPLMTGFIIPSFANAHTHIGDSFIKNKNLNLPKNIEELVAPPDGLKHKLLKEANENELIDGMEESIDTMLQTGISTFCDFREDGILGVCLLKTALLSCNISSIILSRPYCLSYNKNEVDVLLNNSEGIGLSSISDWDYSEIEKIANHTKKKNKIFAIHASERTREEIDVILDLKPNFLVHMIKASESDLIRVKESSVPIVICPRSNYFYGLKTNFDVMKKIGNNIILGTDNAMLNSPSISDEISFLKSKYNLFSDEELLKMSTYKPRKVLNQECDILGSNSKADFIVLNKENLKPLYVSI